jgi:hypothetical protein
MGPSPALFDLVLATHNQAGFVLRAAESIRPQAALPRPSLPPAILRRARNLPVR